MEQDEIDNVPDPYTKAIFELLMRVFSPDNPQLLASMLKGAHVTVIKNDGYLELNTCQSAVEMQHSLDDAQQCLPKPLLPLNDFDNYVFDLAYVNEVKEFLNEKSKCLDHKGIAAMIACAYESGLLCEYPTYRAVMHQFGFVTTKHEYHDCLRAGFTDDDKAPFLEAFKAKKAELLTGQEAEVVDITPDAEETLQPLPWRRLFTTSTGSLSMAVVLAKLKMVYEAVKSFYFNCSEEEFYACFGLPEGSRPKPIVWLCSARVLNYFLKRLFAGKMKGWGTAAALFVRPDGTRYNHLATQIIDDEEEKSAIDAIFEKILKINDQESAHGAK